MYSRRTKWKSDLAWMHHQDLHLTSYWDGLQGVGEIFYNVLFTGENNSNTPSQDTAPHLLHQDYEDHEAIRHGKCFLGRGVFIIKWSCCDHTLQHLVLDEKKGVDHVMTTNPLKLKSSFVIFSNRVSDHCYLERLRSLLFPAGDFNLASETYVMHANCDVVQ